MYAQPDEGVLHVAQHALHRQRNLELRIGDRPQGGLRERLHLGGSFLCLLGTRMIPCGRKEPPPSLHEFNRVRDITGPSSRTHNIIGASSAIVGLQRNDITICGRLIFLRSKFNHSLYLVGVRSQGKTSQSVDIKDENPCVLRANQICAFESADSLIRT